MAFRCCGVQAVEGACLEHDTSLPEDIHHLLAAISHGVQASKWPCFLREHTSVVHRGDHRQAIPLAHLHPFHLSAFTSPRDELLHPGKGRETKRGRQRGTLRFESTAKLPPAKCQLKYSRVSEFVVERVLHLPGLHESERPAVVLE